jgi:hypothetical protein
MTIISGTGELASSPAAVYLGNGHVNVYIRGNDNQIYEKRFDGTSWSGWQVVIGGSSTVTGDPAVTTSGNGVVNLFVRGTDNALYHTYYVSGSWVPWTWLGW